MTGTVLIGDDHRALDVQLRDTDGIEVAAPLTENGSGPAILITSSGGLADPGPVRDRCGVRDPIPEAELREGVVRLSAAAREEVLELMAERRSKDGIAEHMVVTERALERRVTRTFGKPGPAPAPEDHRRGLAVLAFLRP